MHIAPYDAVIVTVGAISIVGVGWAGYKMSRHSREVRVYQQVRMEYPLGVWPDLPKWNEPKKFPAWLVKLAAYLLPIPKREDDSQS